MHKHKGFVYFSNDEINNSEVFRNGGYISINSITEVFQNDAGVWIHTARMNFGVNLTLEEVMRRIDEANE